MRDDWAEADVLREGPRGRVVRVRHVDGRQGVLREVPDSVDATTWNVEAEALAQLSSPWVPSLFEVGLSESDGKTQAYLVREWIDGEPLDQLPWKDGLSRLHAVTCEILEALDSIHRQGWLHGDLTGSNILLTQDGTVRLTDLDLSASVRGGDSHLAGSAYSIAPERLLGRPVDGRSDLFSLGVLLHERLGAEFPDDPSDFYARFPREEFAACIALPDEGDVRLRALARRLVAVDPERRPESAGACLAWIDKESSSPRRLVPTIPASLPLRMVAGRAAERLSAERRGVAFVGCRTREDAESWTQELRLRATLLGLSSAPLGPTFAAVDGSGDVLWSPLSDASLLLASSHRLFDRGGWLVLHGDPDAFDEARWPWIERWGDVRLAPDRVADELFGASPRDAERALASELVERCEGRHELLSLALAELGDQGTLRSVGERWERTERPVDWARVRARWEQPSQSISDPDAAAVALALAASGGALEEALLRDVFRDSVVTFTRGLRALRRTEAVVSTAGGWQLSHRVRAEADEETRISMHARLAECWASRDLARSFRHRLASGDDQRIATSVRSDVAGIATDPTLRASFSAWLDVLEGAERDLPLLLGAARLSNLWGDLEASQRWFEEAVARRDGTREQRLAVLVELADLMVRRGEVERALDLYRLGLRRTKGHPEEGLFARGVCDLLARSGNVEQARVLAERTLRKAEHLPVRSRIQLECEAARLGLLKGASEAAATRLRMALAEARRALDDGAVAMVRTLQAVTFRQLGKLRAAVDAAREALALQERRQDAPAVADLHRNLGIYLRDVGEISEADHHLELAMTQASWLGRPRDAARATLARGRLILDRGRLDAARPLVDQASKALKHAVEFRDRALSQLLSWEMRVASGRRAGAREAYRAWASEAMARNERDIAWRAGLECVFEALDRGDVEWVPEFLGTLERAVGSVPASLAVRREVAWLIWGRLAGDPTPKLLARWDALDSQLGPQERLEAELERLACEGADVASLERSEAAVRRLSSVRHLVEVLTWKAVALERMGDRHGAAAACRERSEALEECSEACGVARLRLLGACLRRRRPALRLEQRSHSRKDPTMTTTTDDLRTFLHLNKRLNLESDLGRLVESILDSAMVLTRAQRGFLVIRDGDEVTFRVARSVQAPEVPEPAEEVSWSFLQEALDDMRPLVTSNAGLDPRFRSRQSVADLELRSVLCHPFMVDETLRGALYLDHPLRERVFGDRELDLVDAFADQAAIALRNLRRREIIEGLNARLQQQLARRSTELGVANRNLERAGIREASPTWIGSSPAFLKVTSQIDRYAATDLPVLVTGESGTGKELAARRVHEQSRRAAGPFVSESCTAVPETLWEAEFFGVRKGAFTGADADRPGLFELADGGTLFLDEIGDLPLGLQAKLLRVLQEGKVRPVGGVDLLELDVRVVSATHRELQAMVANGDFRQDLYYRISAAQVHLPALRERGDDVLELASWWLDRLASEHGSRRVLSEESRQRLAAHDWPGNIRELLNELQRLDALADGDVLEWSPSKSADPVVGGGPFESWDALPTLKQLEALALQDALRRRDGSKDEAARLLGMSRASVYAKAPKIEAVLRGTPWGVQGPVQDLDS